MLKPASHRAKWKKYPSEKEWLASSALVERETREYRPIVAEYPRWRSTCIAQP